MTGSPARRLRAVVVVAAIAGARWTFAQGLDAGATPPGLAVSPATVDVGPIEVVARTAAATVHVTNTGTAPLKLLAIQLLDGGTGAAADWTLTPRAPCTTTLPPACTLTDGQTVDLDLTFDPQSIGVRDATLLISYHDTADRSLSVPLHGAGAGPTLDLAAAPATLDFGTLPVGTPGTLTLEVADHGTRNLTDGTAQLMPAGPPFSISPGPSLAVTTAAPTLLAVTCTPATAGTFTADLQLSAPDAPSPPTLIHLRCAADPATALVATPPAILLGEVRTGTPIVSHVAIASLAAPISLTGASLETLVAGLTVSGAPATTPATLALTAARQTDGSLDDRLTIAPNSGPPLTIAVTGAAVTASYSVPMAVSLGTTCVQQPTTPRILALSSTGTATLGLTAPALQNASSPFDLVLVAPVGYPNLLAPHQRATIAVTPKRRDTAGQVSDDVIWATDVAGLTTAHTTLTASFVADGGAIAPGALSFGSTPVHVDTHNAQQVTLQNCSSAPLQLDPPAVPVPFSIDSPNFPTALNPGEIATFSVGFHPTKVGKVSSKTLSITSPQLHDPLTVELSGDGVAPGADGNASPPTTDLPTTSFYACSCTANDPSAAIAITLAALGVLVPRRRRAQ
ncbi:MAG TPA: choice-of-anchor D domain-containing protein [Kofleriaceae bacterium]